jgi:hypothetical protein
VCVEVEIRSLIAEEVRIVQVGGEEVGFFVTAHRNIRMRAQVVVGGRCPRPGRSHEKQVWPTHGY